MVPEDSATPQRAEHALVVAGRERAAGPRAASGGAARGGSRLDRPPAVSDRVLASWRRSEGYGVALEGVRPVFGGEGPDDSLFLRCGQEVLGNLHRTLADEPISLMLTDAEGLVLDRRSGDTSLLRALDAVHLAPGFAFSEREAGTNGLGLALADRVPALVRAEEHYSLSLCGYTCAAVPVLDPASGRLEGSVNITTWSRDRGDLLLALAQSAASTTAALMLARSRGLSPRPAPRGEVYRVEPARLEPGSGTASDLCVAWTDAVARAAAALREGRVVAAVGEPGSGRATLLAQAARLARPRDRVLSATLPPPQDVTAWLGLWLPEVAKENTSVIACDVDELPLWAAGDIADAFAGAGRAAAVAVTAQGFDRVPDALGRQVDAVVPVPPLRERPGDVLALAQHVARRVRGRDVELTPAAQRALTDCDWPGNVTQLVAAVRHAVTRTDVVDVRHLPTEVLSGSRRRLTRIEAFEREELVRCLTRPGATMREVAEELGMSRATIYRKIAQYDLHLPRP